MATTEGAPIRPPRYGFLLLASIACLAVQGIVAPRPVQQVLVTALAGTTLLLALRSARFPHRLVAAAILLASTALVLSVVRATGAGIGEGAAAR